MKKLLWLALLLPFFAQAQVNGTIQKTTSTKTVRGNFGASGLDTLVQLQTNSLSNLDMLRFNSTTGKFEPRTPSQVRTDIGAGTGSGSVTSIATNTGTGITGGTITTTGTIAADTASVLVTKALLANYLAKNGLSFGTFGSSPNANGGSYSAGVITLQPASASFPGGVTTGTQTFAGAKTFAGLTSNNGSLTSTSSNSSSLSQVINTGTGDAFFGSLRANTTLGASGTLIQGVGGAKWFVGTPKTTNRFRIINTTTSGIFPTGSNTIPFDIDTLNNITLSSLTNGLVKSTSGVLSNATAGTDYAAATGGAGYIQNQVASSQSANFWIGGGTNYIDQTLRIGRPNASISSGAASFLQLANSNTGTNWQVTANDAVVGAFDIQPSTTSGGTTFSGAPIVRVTTSGLTISPGVSANNLTINGAAAANGTARFTLAPSNSAYNWQISTNNNNAGEFEILPSTAAGGTTFSSTVFRVSQPGDLVITGSNATKATGTAWINPSDKRLKTDIKPYAKGLKELLAIQPSQWRFNKASGYDTKSLHVSPIAQELAKVMPEMVSTYKGKLDGKEVELMQVDGSDFTMLLINSVKELAAQVKELQAEIKALKK